MINRFKKHINDQLLFNKEDSIILAISGGADSVCLALILKELNFNFSLAHCNFNLRGLESDTDEGFVRELADKMKVNVHVKKFDTLKYSTSNKISVQMAARDLRYKWFEELRKRTSSKYILVAHHSNDEIETFFINLVRGSGIRGLIGMKEKRDNIVRPLLTFSRNDIENFLNLKNQNFRTDSSNVDTKYLRNNIRENLIPLLKDMNPAFDKTFLKEIEHLNEVFTVFEDRINALKKEIIRYSGDNLIINKKKFITIKERKVLLREILSPFGFTQTEQILECCFSISGKIFYSEEYKLLVDRNDLIVNKKSEDVVAGGLINRVDKEIISPIAMKFSVEEEISVENKKTIAFFDFNKLDFPLTIRKWKEGDFFHPLGMRGKKKLSDFFIDEKFSIFEKEECFLLCNKEEIIWIIGHRISEKYKISATTKKAYIAELF